MRTMLYGAVAAAASVLGIVARTARCEITYTAVDLNPAGFVDSYALGIAGTGVAGYGSSTAAAHTNYHALLWNRSSGSFIDLNPTGFNSTFAYGASGTQQIGSGFGAATGGPQIAHALLWSGSATAVDLNPAGFTQSQGYGIAG